MSNLFANHSYSSLVLKHKKLPVYKTTEFDFFRCVCIDDWVYNKTVSELHLGNLRLNNNAGRYSRLFPNERISYWADSITTALAEIKKHGGNKNYLTFWAYDDVSSTFPILNIDEPLTIIDGRDLKFHQILLKIENEEELTREEYELIELIKNEKPDCLAYNSVAYKNGVNFLFFENGFNKLVLREVKLYYGERKSKNSNSIICAQTSDYFPIIENYGKYFLPIAKKKMDKSYFKSDEYIFRANNLKKSLKQLKIDNGVIK